MLISHQNEKTFNAILYFLDNTSMCNKKKLFKLLFLLDFEHFAETGRSVTGFDYEAWDRGPVPTELNKKMRASDPEFLEYVDVELIEGKKDYKTISLNPKKKFDERFFSRRQLRLLASIADRFSMMTGAEMEAYTHLPGGPWDRVYNVENNKNGSIPYQYELDRLNPDVKEIIMGIAEERDQFLQNYG